MQCAPAQKKVSKISYVYQVSTGRSFATRGGDFRLSIDQSLLSRHTGRLLFYVNGTLQPPVGEADEAKKDEGDGAKEGRDVEDRRGEERNCPDVREPEQRRTNDLRAA